MLMSFLTVLTICARLVISAEFKKHVQNSVYPYDVDPPTYNIESWVKQLHLQQCALVEVGDKYYAIFVETRPRRYDKERGVREYFLGLCDDETLSKWSLCASNLQQKRADDCNFINGDMYGTRVHRRLCDITLLALNAPQCDCNVDLAESKLFKVQGFPTCFKAPLPDSLCGDNNVCGLSSCNPQTINKRIHTVVCDRKCYTHQPFCEPPNKKSSQPRSIKSYWTDWSNPFCTDASCLSQFDEAMCINRKTGGGDIDCLGPGTSCCTPDLQNCRCHVYEENGMSKVFRTFSLPPPDLVEYMSEEDFINSIPLRYLNKEEFHKYPFGSRSARSNFGQAVKKTLHNIYESMPVRFGNKLGKTHELKRFKGSLLKPLKTSKSARSERSGKETSRKKKVYARDLMSRSHRIFSQIDGKTHSAQIVRNIFNSKPNLKTILRETVNKENMDAILPDDDYGTAQTKTTFEDLTQGLSTMEDAARLLLGETTEISTEEIPHSTPSEAISGIQNSSKLQAYGNSEEYNEKQLRPSSKDEEDDLEESAKFGEKSKDLKDESTNVQSTASKESQNFGDNYFDLNLKSTSESVPSPDNDLNLNENFNSDRNTFKPGKVVSNKNKNDDLVVSTKTNQKPYKVGFEKNYNSFYVGNIIADLKSKEKPLGDESDVDYEKDRLKTSTPSQRVDFVDYDLDNMETKGDAKIGDDIVDKEFTKKPLVQGKENDMKTKEVAIKPLVKETTNDVETKKMTKKPLAQQTNNDIDAEESMNKHLSQASKIVNKTKKVIKKPLVQETKNDAEAKEDLNKHLLQATEDDNEIGEVMEKPSVQETKTDMKGEDLKENPLVQATDDNETKEVTKKPLLQENNDEKVSSKGDLINLNKNNLHDLIDGDDTYRKTVKQESKDKFYPHGSIKSLEKSRNPNQSLKTAEKGKNTLKGLKMVGKSGNSIPSLKTTKENGVMHSTEEDSENLLKSSTKPLIFQDGQDFDLNKNLLGGVTKIETAVKAKETPKYEVTAESAEVPSTETTRVVEITPKVSTTLKFKGITKFELPSSFQSTPKFKSTSKLGTDLKFDTIPDIKTTAFINTIEYGDTTSKIGLSSTEDELDDMIEAAEASTKPFNPENANTIAKFKHFLDDSITTNAYEQTLKLENKKDKKHLKIYSKNNFEDQDQRTFKKTFKLKDHEGKYYPNKKTEIITAKGRKESFKIDDERNRSTINKKHSRTNDENILKISAEDQKHIKPDNETHFSTLNEFGKPLETDDAKYFATTNGQNNLLETDDETDMTTSNEYWQPLITDEETDFATSDGHWKFMETDDGMDFSTTNGFNKLLEIDNEKDFTTSNERLDDADLAITNAFKEALEKDKESKLATKVYEEHSETNNVKGFATSNKNKEHLENTNESNLGTKNKPKVPSALLGLKEKFYDKTDSATLNKHKEHSKTNDDLDLAIANKLKASSTMIGRKEHSKFDVENDSARTNVSKEQTETDESNLPTENNLKASSTAIGSKEHLKFDDGRVSATSSEHKEHSEMDDKIIVAAANKLPATSTPVGYKESTKTDVETDFAARNEHMKHDFATLNGLLETTDATNLVTGTDHTTSSISVGLRTTVVKEDSKMNNEINFGTPNGLEDHSKSTLIQDLRNQGIFKMITPSINTKYLSDAPDELTQSTYNNEFRSRNPVFYQISSDSEDCAEAEEAQRTTVNYLKPEYYTTGNTLLDPSKKLQIMAWSKRKGALTNQNGMYQKSGRTPLKTVARSKSIDQKSDSRITSIGLGMFTRSTSIDQKSDGRSTIIDQQLPSRRTSTDHKILATVTSNNKETADRRTSTDQKDLTRKTSDQETLSRRTSFNQNSVVTSKSVDPLSVTRSTPTDEDLITVSKPTDQDMLTRSTLIDQSTFNKDSIVEGLITSSAPIYQEMFTDRTPIYQKILNKGPILDENLITNSVLMDQELLSITTPVEEILTRNTQIEQKLVTRVTPTSTPVCNNNSISENDEDEDEEKFNPIHRTPKSSYSKLELLDPEDTSENSRSNNNKVGNNKVLLLTPDKQHEVNRVIFLSPKKRQRVDEIFAVIPDKKSRKTRRTRIHRLGFTNAKILEFPTVSNFLRGVGVTQTEASKLSSNVESSTEIEEHIFSNKQPKKIDYDEVEILRNEAEFGTESNTMLSGKVSAPIPKMGLVAATKIPRNEYTTTQSACGSFEKKKFKPKEDDREDFMVLEEDLDSDIKIHKNVEDENEQVDKMEKKAQNEEFGKVIPEKLYSRKYMVQENDDLDNITSDATLQLKGRNTLQINNANAENEDEEHEHNQTQPQTLVTSKTLSGEEEDEDLFTPLTPQKCRHRVANFSNKRRDLKIEDVTDDDDEDDDEDIMIEYDGKESKATTTESVERGANKNRNLQRENEDKKLSEEYSNITKKNSSFVIRFTFYHLFFIFLLKYIFCF